MKPISWQRWAATFAILLVLSFLADYFFLHILFDPTHRPHFPHLNGTNGAVVDTSETTPTEPDQATTAAPNTSGTPTAEKSSGENNFLRTLQECREDVSSQGITTPEALMNYLDQSIGKESESVDIENFILFLPDGSERRVHIVVADNTNSKDKREVRYFGVDSEGYPQAIDLTPEQKQMPVDTLKNSLVAQGKVREHQVKKTVNLRDGSFLNLETHNDKVYEFQWRGPNNTDRTLSCRNLNCVCRD